MRHRLALLLALGPTACLAPPPRVFVFTYDGSDQGYAYAVSAANEWRSVCGAQTMVTRQLGGIPIHEVPASELPPGWGGVTIVDDGKPESVTVRVGAARVVYVHELGHAIGIHTHLDHGVMAQPPDADAVTGFECDAL